MRRSREDKAKTRLEIVEAASRLFRKRGIANVSIADVMGAIGLTIGGFYRHFEDKDALVAEAIDHASKSTVMGDATLAQVLDRYLSKDHRANVEKGCPVAALCSEIAREHAPARRAFTDAVKRIIEATSGRRDRKRQLAMMAQAVGGLVLSRAVDDPKLSDEILSAVRTDLDV